jgi:hypothetical protein
MLDRVRAELWREYIWHEQRAIHKWSAERIKANEQNETTRAERSMLDAPAEGQASGAQEDRGGGA